MTISRAVTRLFANGALPVVGRYRRKAAVADPCGCLQQPACRGTTRIIPQAKLHSPAGTGTPTRLLSVLISLAVCAQVTAEPWSGPKPNKVSVRQK